MEWITVISNWFAENESVLSGLVAFIALMGLLISPFGDRIKGLFVKAEQQTGGGAPQSLTPRGEGKPSIYIEPFTGSSDEANILAAELNEDVRRAVANLTGSILTTDSTLADYVANVNILFSGKRCRATLRLHDCMSNEDFWSGRFEAAMDERLETIDQLSSKLSTSIRYEVARRFRNRTDGGFEVKLARMGYAMVSSEPVIWEEALQIADELSADQADNSMFQAIYSGLLLQELALGYRPVPYDKLQKAKRAIQKAVALNERSDFAHAMMGRYHLYCERDFNGARRSYERSLDINPLYHFGQRGLGLVEVFSGDPQKGVELLLSASTIEQGSKGGQLIQAVAAGEIRLGNYEKALEWIEHNQDPNEEYVGTSLIFAVAASLADRPQIAQETVQGLKEKHADISIASLRRWPYKDDADWALFVSGLKKAGLE